MAGEPRLRAMAGCSRRDLAGLAWIEVNGGPKLAGPRLKPTADVGFLVQRGGDRLQSPALSEKFDARIEPSQRCLAGLMDRHNGAGWFVCCPFHVGLAARVIRWTTHSPADVGDKRGIGRPSFSGEQRSAFAMYVIVLCYLGSCPLFLA